MAFLDPVLTPLLQPLLNASPFLSILILAFVVSIIITLVYKLVTNQELMKSLKDKQKDFQKQMKELRSNPEEMMKVQKEAMKINMDYMKQSFKPTLITMLPIILIFGWMAAHLSFEPIYPGEPYSITVDFKEGLTGEAELIPEEGTEVLSEATQKINGALTWNLKSSSGEHYLKVKTGNVEETKKVLITKDLMYEQQFSVFKHSEIDKISINYNKLKPLGTFKLFGWQPGWLGLYIIFSIVFSMVLRKVMGIY